MSDIVVSAIKGDRGELTDRLFYPVERCLEANLTTGTCYVFEVNDQGAIVRNGREPSVLKIQRPAPLKFERRN